MQKKIYITGIGAISSIGLNAAECFNSICENKSGISNIEILKTVHKNSFLAGEIKLNNTELYNKINSPKISNNQTRTSLLGIIAAQEAISDSGIDIQDTGIKTGIISATTNGGMDRTETELFENENDFDFVKTHSCGDSTDKICAQFNFKGYRTTLSTACSSSANAIIHAVRLINNGIIDRALVGGTDALSKFTVNGFNSLMILDKEHCKPFDENRNGLNLGEGAAYIVIESEKCFSEKFKKTYCRIAGFANANDAFHQTASSPEGDGAYKAMYEALKLGGLKTDDIDYINAHGTATKNNDLTEGKAIEKFFGEKTPHFSSTKAFTGHTLGASAAIEAVLSALAIYEGVIYPNFNLTNHMKEINIKANTKLIKRNVSTVLSNSFGFGGNNSTIIFSK